MAINYEFERHIDAAKAAGDKEAVATLEAHKVLFNNSVAAGKVKELPKEQDRQDAALPPSADFSINGHGHSAGKDVLTMREAGEYLGVSQPTLRKLVRQGVVSAFSSEVDRRTKVIFRSALDALNRRGTPVLVLASLAALLFPAGISKFFA